MAELNRGYNEDNIELLKRMPDRLLDIICIDPPYLYLKGQKLERPFDEQLFFSECKRVLKKDGFLILFGRGISFYRWNTILDGLGFTFKEEIVWDKVMTASPVNPVSRRHETVSIWCNGAAQINRVKLPFIESYQYDPAKIEDTLYRLISTFGNRKTFDLVREYYETGKYHYNEGKDSANNITVQRGLKKTNRTLQFAITMEEGCLERTIMRQKRGHKNDLHPTQKPVRLLERLLALVKPKHENIIAADFFAGSFSFAEACINMGIDWICCEIDKEYYEGGTERISKLIRTKELHPQQGKLAI